MSALIISLLVAGMLGAWMVYVGLRGRRIDDHPLCRKCGFDLTGRNEQSDRCSECGARLDLPHAIVVGHRMRRGALLNSGVMLCFLTAVIAAGSMFPAVRNFDLTPYKPHSWLIHDLDSADTTVRSVAMAELRRRFENKRLPADAAHGLGKWILKVQGDSSQPWDQAYGRFVEALRDSKLLSDEQWITYIDQGLMTELTARPSARQGDPMPFQLRPSGQRLGDRQIKARYAWEYLQVDGRDTKLPDFKNLTLSVSHGAASWSSPPIGSDEAMTKDLAPGLYQAQGKLRLEIWDVIQRGGTDSSALPETPPLKLVVRDLTTSFEILPADADVKFAVVDETLREKMKNLLTANVTFTPPNQLSVDLELAAPPVRLVGKSVIRVNGKAFDLDPWIEARPNQGSGYRTSKTMDIGDATKVDIAFIPEPDKVRRSVNPAPTWGEEIVVKDMPVQRKETSK